MPPKGKPDTAAYQKLKQDLKSGALGSLYIFHGEEAYLRDYYLGEMKKKAAAAGYGGLQLPYHQRQGV